MVHQILRSELTGPIGAPPLIGTWRSLVAHYTGGVGVVGSNPAVPTILKAVIYLPFFLFYPDDNKLAAASRSNK